MDIVIPTRILLVDFAKTVCDIIQQVRYLKTFNAQTHPSPRPAPPAVDEWGGSGVRKVGKQISPPFSSGGGGPNFEVRVQASFVALMLTDGFAPYLPGWSIKKIKLQGKFEGYDTDDLIVFAESPDGIQKRKMLAQIKHSISITENNKIFREVISAAWSDFNGCDFSKNEDIIALITGPLSATDVNDVRTILEWARYSNSSDEFIQ